MDDGEMEYVRVYLYRSVLDDRWGGEGRGCDEWQSGGPTGHGAGASGVGRGQGPGSESCEERTSDVGYCLASTYDQPRSVLYVPGRPFPT